MVAPRIELHARADGKRRDLVQIFGASQSLATSHHSEARRRDCRAAGRSSAGKIFECASSCFRKSPALPSLSLYGEFFRSFSPSRQPFCMFGAVAEREVAQRFDGGDVGRIVEAPLIGGRLGDDDVGQFLGQHGCQAAFIRQNVEQSSAHNDGVADRERFRECR